MTWEEWIDSDYNSDGWYYDDMDGAIVSNEAFSDYVSVSADMDETISEKTYDAYYL